MGEGTFFHVALGKLTTLRVEDHTYKNIWDSQIGFDGFFFFLKDTKLDG